MTSKLAACDDIIWLSFLYLAH